MHTRTLGLALLLAACAWAGSADGANWPRFRGPNGTGVVDDADLPVAWTAKNFAWKTALPGVGNSSPVVWGDRLFLQAARADGKERSLLCLNVADGKVLWSTPVPGGLAKIHPKSSLASSTPATDGERVYAMFWDGERVALYGFDFKGKQLWAHDLGAYTSQHGAGNSPIVHAGKVYLLNDHDRGASVVALDGKSGKTVWEAGRQHERAFYSTPFLLERPAEGVELVVGSTHAITGYDPETGAKNWEYERKFDGMPLRTVASPALADGLIVAAAGDGKGDRHTVAVVPGGKASGVAPRLAWEIKKTMPYVPCFLSRGDHVYWVNDMGLAGCTVAKTGETVWSERLGTKGVTASPILVGGKVYAPNEAGEVYVFAAEPRFKLLAKNPLGEAVLASPAVADGRLFVRGEKHLFCVGKAAK